MNYPNSIFFQFFFKISFFIVLLLTLTSSFSAPYYADIDIEVKETGKVLIDGTTNYEYFKNTESHQFTTKDKEMWLLNISTQDDNFSNYIFRVILPQGASVNYIKTTPNIRFETIDSKLNIIGVGNDKPIDILIQYSFKDEIDLNSHTIGSFILDNLIVLLFLIIIVILIILSLYGMRIKSSLNNKEMLDDKKYEINGGIQHKKFENTLKYKNQSNKEDEEENLEFVKNIHSYLPQRQKQIIEILCDKKQITQKKLELKLNIPKSSVSRNIQSLVNKRIIIKKESGNTNILELHEDILEKCKNKESK